jgi:hypothetical protein
MLGLNEIAILAKTFAQGEELYLQIVRRDDHIRPNPALQVVLCDERSIGLDQHDQDIECPRPKFDRHAAGKQSPLAIAHKSAELESCVGWGQSAGEEKIVIHRLTPSFC